MISARSYGPLNHVFVWDDSSVTIEQIKFFPFYDKDNDNRRSIKHSIEKKAAFPVTEGELPVQSLARVNVDGRQVRVDFYADGSLELMIAEEEESLFGSGELKENFYQLDFDAVGKVSAATLTTDGTKLYAGTDQGEILRWDLTDIDDPVLEEVINAFSDLRKITALNMVFGDVSLIVGDR